jgi:hypothetical protein
MTPTATGIESLVPSPNRGVGQLVEPKTAFTCGLVAMVIGMTIAIFIPRPEPFQLRIFSVFMGLGAASFTTGLTGLLEIKTKWLTAGGPLAVLVFIVYFVGGLSLSGSSLP